MKVSQQKTFILVLMFTTFQRKNIYYNTNKICIVFKEVFLNDMTL